MKKTILMADDADIVVNLGRALFNREGCEVLTATDGDDALKLSRERNPDIVLVDLKMPGKDGFSILKELKDDPKTADIPVIVFSGSSRPEDMDKCLNAGAADYLTKPLRLEDLLKRTAKILDIPVRKHMRIPIQLEIFGIEGGEVFEGETRDISIGGIFIATSSALKVSSRLKLRFRLPYQTKDLEIVGKVVREVPPMPTRGYGIEFVEASKEVITAIEQFIEGQDS
ncbi:MAG: response regulator [Deltaproteobacteria bacterium]|nr:response regulator [Deltaproteobacteria bacterium]